MVIQEETQDRVRHLLREALPMLCKSGLAFASEFSVDALIGITLNKDDVFLVSIKETIKSDNVEGEEDLNDKREMNTSSLEDVTLNQRRKPHRKRRRSKASTSKHSDSENSSMSNDETEDTTAVKREKRDEDRTEHKSMYNHTTGVQSDSSNVHQDTADSQLSSNQNTDIRKTILEEENESNDAIIVKEEPADFSSFSFSDANEQAFNMTAFSQHGAPMAAHFGAPNSISSPHSQSLPIPGPSYGQPVQMVRNLNTSTTIQGNAGAEGQAAGAPGAMYDIRPLEDVPHDEDSIKDLIKRVDDCSYKIAGVGWKCTFCTHVATRKYSAKTHVLGKHLNFKITCGCGQEFKWRALLNVHKKSCPKAY